MWKKALRKIPKKFASALKSRTNFDKNLKIVVQTKKFFKEGVCEYMRLTCHDFFLDYFCSPTQASVLYEKLCKREKKYCEKKYRTLLMRERNRII